jgi:hypothetical protein
LVYTEEAWVSLQSAYWRIWNFDPYKAGKGMKRGRFKRSLLAGSIAAIFVAPAMILADDINVNLCNATSDVVLDAAKARDAGVSEAAYLSQQGVNATDDVEKVLVYLVYHDDRDLPIKMLRDNVFKTCVATDQWSNCKPLTPKTGIMCVPQ